MAMGPDIRELSFQNVIDSILKPAGVKVGGYPDDMFLDMSEEDKEKWTCNICYLIVREARQCDNKHLFCQTCCFAWTLTFSDNSQRCPMCRSEQKEYKPVDGVDAEVGKHRVLCPDDDCDFRAPLSIFLQHSHGMKRFRNETSDLESLRPNRRPGAQLLVFPRPVGGNPMERALSLRDQLTQGRMMLHQMMLLLQLEMQLRRQAAISMMQDNGPRQVDDMVALNEQLSEVGGVLHALMNVPVPPRSENSGANPAARFILATLGDDDSTSESSESSESTIVPRHRSQYIIRGNRNRLNANSLSGSQEHEGDRSSRMTIRLSPRNQTLPSSVSNSHSGPTERRPSIQISVSPRQSLSSSRESESNTTERPVRRSDIRNQLYGNTGQVSTSSESSVPSTTPRILQRATQHDASINTVNTRANSQSQSVPQINTEVSEEVSSSTTPLSLVSPGRSTQVRGASRNQGVTARHPDRAEPNNQSSPTSLPPITTGQLSTSRQVAEANSPVPPGSSAHQRTLRELTVNRPSNRNQASEEQSVNRDTEDEPVVTVYGSGPTERNNRSRRESSTRQVTVTEQSQVAQSQIRQSLVNFHEPSSSQQEPTTSESPRRPSVSRASQYRNTRTSGTQDSSQVRTSGSYSPQKRFRRDSNNRPVLRQVQPNSSGQSTNTNGMRTSRPSQNNQQGSRTENSLPTTPGSLMRARRRSEIQRQLHDSFNDS